MKPKKNKLSSPPKKPWKPSAPVQMLFGSTEKYIVSDGESLDTVLNKIDPARLPSATFSIDYPYYDDIAEISIIWETEERPNPNYDAELKQYEAEMVEYRKAMKIYQSDLKEYKLLEKEHLKQKYRDLLEDLERAEKETK